MCGRFVQTPTFKPDQLGLPDLAQDLLELPPNYNMAPTQHASVILDRMPVWLQPDQVDEWMAAEPDDAMAMLLASEPPSMEAYRVSRAVNSPRNNVAELLNQVE